MATTCAPQLFLNFKHFYNYIVSLLSRYLGIMYKAHKRQVTFVFYFLNPFRLEEIFKSENSKDYK
jgi:hypothetical protein